MALPCPIVLSVGHLRQRLTASRWRERCERCCRSPVAPGDALEQTLARGIPSGPSPPAAFGPAAFHLPRRGLPVALPVASARSACLCPPLSSACFWSAVALPLAPLAVLA